MTSLNPGQVFRFGDEDRLERLLWVDPTGGNGWFIAIEDDRAVPVYREDTEIRKLIVEGVGRSP